MFITRVNAASQHLLSPNPSPFFEVKLLYDYGLRRDGGNKAAIFGNIAIIAASSQINENVNICSYTVSS